MFYRRSLCATRGIRGREARGREHEIKELRRNSEMRERRLEGSTLVPSEKDKTGGAKERVANEARNAKSLRHRYC